MSEPQLSTEGRAASAVVDVAPRAGTYAAPFLSRLTQLEQQLAEERTRRERAERLAASLAHRLAAEHQRRVAAEVTAEHGDDLVPVVLGAGAATEASAPFARWRTLRPDAAGLDERG